MAQGLRAGALVAVLLGAVVGLRAGATGDADARGTAKPACELPDEPITYKHVEPIFAAKCASCHDARKSDNRPPQRVFEMSSYPFATERPNTLIADLQKMFTNRGNLTADEKCLGLAWLAGGARDAEGNAPRWRK